MEINSMVNDLTITLFGRSKLNRKMSFRDALSFLQDLDLIDVGELAEKAVAKKTGVGQTTKSHPGCDLVNGWEIKHGQTHLNSKGTQRRAYVAGMQNKTGTLRIIITERLTGKLYFFKVPHRAYRDYCNSSLQWAFEVDGTPQRRALRAMTRPNYWDYQVESFDELCCQKKTYD
jgi:hypothetical protein